ncbi:SPASM domain-containing protein [Marinifilum sp.]|uniref:SPASM domain-containing protein n=1 Tax=Marinifilum sp. TaxID=2033137 RepID=UPI003BA9B315
MKEGEMNFSLSFKHLSKMINTVKNIEVPRVAHFSLLKQCNWNCVFCYQSKEKIDLSKIELVLEKLISSNISEVTLYGGEITLIKDWLLLGERLQENGIRASFISNGELLWNADLKIIEKIQNTFSGASFSMHGIGKIHDIIVGKKGAFLKQIETIKKLYFSGFNICINVTVSTYNLLYLEETLLFIISRFPGVPIVINRAINHASEKSDAPYLNKQEVIFMLETVEQIKKAGNNIEIKGGVPIPPCILPEHLKEYAMFCSAGFDFVDIDGEGNVFLCPEFGSSIGNILNEPLPKIWNNIQVSKYRDLDWLNEKCRDCDDLTYCWGGCKANKSTDHIIFDKSNEIFFVTNPDLRIRKIDNEFGFSLPNSQVIIGTESLSHILDSLKEPQLDKELIKNFEIDESDIDFLVNNQFLIKIFRNNLKFYQPEEIKKAGNNVYSK